MLFLSKIETEFEFSEEADAHSTDGSIKISKNKIFIRLGIEGEQPIQINNGINKLNF